jgi:hypothetical protein
MSRIAQEKRRFPQHSAPDFSLPGIGEAARLDPGALFSALGTSPSGLTRHEASARLAGFGPNTVARERPPLRSGACFSCSWALCRCSFSRSRFWRN